MSIVNSPTYNIEALSNINIKSKNLNLNSKDTNVYGNINIFGQINGNFFNEGTINGNKILNSLYIDGSLTVRDTINANKILNSLYIDDSLTVRDTINANKYKVINGIFDGNISFNDQVIFKKNIQTNGIDMDGGNISIRNGSIIGPVKIYGLLNMDAGSINLDSNINTPSVVFVNKNIDKNFDFSILETGTKPPECCQPTWIKIQINGKPFYLFSQSPV